ncbi:hypothetical protein ACJ73_00377 [Blastomyces percursus]|uniref:Uncharacterized protein n=1 Tax=Blastomyces percursus TaxID=1658174 RepID=A0A1J9RJS4_9EURO|nr:hypothetical protein ACJ73_00377 [Blastomyces percursus]
MGILLITFQRKCGEVRRGSNTSRSESSASDTVDMTDEQVISRVRDTPRLLEQLGTAGAAELLDRVKASEPNPPSFVWKIDDPKNVNYSALVDQRLCNV